MSGRARLHAAAVLLLLATLLTQTSAVGNAAVGNLDVNNAPKCVPISTPMCRNISYNYTVERPRLQNFLLEPAEVERDMHYWSTLMTFECSKHRLLFICSAYHPYCLENIITNFGPVGPCRRLCEEVRSRCESLLLSAIQTSWPERVACEQFEPQNGPNRFCVDIPNDNGPKLPLPSSTTTPAVEVSQHPCANSPRPENFVYINRSERCALLCNRSFLFTPEQKDVAQTWAVVMSSICFVCTLATVFTITVGITNDHFRFPQRPIVFVAGCYCAMSLAYVIRFMVGRETVSCTTDSGTQRQVLALEGLDNAWCSLVFLISYFFGLAGATWWCLLTVSLALATVWRKSHDSIKHYASYFYTLGLGAPALVIIVLLVLRWVDADELLGMCYVGNHNPTALLYFVIVPHFIILLVGTIFLTLGFVAQMRARRRQTVVGAKADNLETAAVKIGSYSVIGFILPSACVIACNIYEYVKYDEWLHSNDPQPAIEMYLLRLLMMFTSGITTVMFIWSRKTIDSWRIVLATLCCRLAHYEKPQPVARSALLSRTASVSRNDYELVQQDERARAAKGLLASSAGADGATRSVHSHAHSSSSGLTASAANQAQSRLPAVVLSTDYLNINQRLLPAGAPFAIDGEANYHMMHVASDAQPPAAYHPAVHQSHMRTHRLSADQLAGATYHCSSWPQPVAFNVVAPPPSLVNICSGPEPTYYMQADSFDTRCLPYAPAKDEAAF